MTAVPRAPAIDSGTGPPLLVFHGWSGSHQNVQRWLPALTPHFRVLVPDLPGCNGVPRLAERHSALAYARWGIGLLDRLGIDGAYAAGLCSGSAIAMTLALEAPDRVRGLLLHTPFVRPDLIRLPIRLQLVALSSPAGAAFRLLRANAVLASVHRRLFANAGEVAAEQLAQDQADLLRADVGAGRELARDLLTVDRTPLLERWTRPMAVLLADQDAFIDAPRTATRIRDAVPQVAVEVIPGGHGWTAAYVAAQLAAFARLAPALART